MQPHKAAFASRSSQLPPAVISLIDFPQGSELEQAYDMSEFVVCAIFLYLIICAIYSLILYLLALVALVIATFVSALRIGKDELLKLICWVFDTRHLEATTRLVLGTWNWILRWISLLIQIGAPVFLKLFFTVTDTENILATGTVVLDAAIWTTSSWRIRVLAVSSVFIGFRAWVSSSGRLDILSITAVAAGMQIYVLTMGHLNIMIVAALLISLRACIISSTRLNSKLLIICILGFTIHVMNPEHPDLIPMAALLMGIAAYTVSTHVVLDKAILGTPVQQVLIHLRGNPVPQATPTTESTAIVRNEIIRPQKTNSRLCTVCGDRKPLSEFLAGPTRRCRHVPRICDEDIKNWIQSQLTNTTWNRIRCPEPNCNEFFQYEDMKTHGSEASFARFDPSSTSR